MIGDSELEILSYDGEGYLPLLRFGAWRVAELRYCDELLPQNIGKLQRHDGTDEAFVLLQGHCTLFLGGRGARLGEIEAQPLEPLRIYNVRRGTWHSHTLSRDATVLIIENEDTCDANSPELPLSPEQRALLQEAARRA